MSLQGALGYGMMLYYKDKKGSTLVIVQASALAVGFQGYALGLYLGVCGGKL